MSLQIEIIKGRKAVVDREKSIELQLVGSGPEDPYCFELAFGGRKIGFKAEKEATRNPDETKKAWDVVWNVAPLKFSKEEEWHGLIKETLGFYGFMGGRDKTGTVVVNFNAQLKKPI